MRRTGAAGRMQSLTSSIMLTMRMRQNFFCIGPQNSGQGLQDYPKLCGAHCICCRRLCSVRPVLVQTRLLVNPSFESECVGRRVASRLFRCGFRLILQVSEQGGTSGAASM